MDPIAIGLVVTVVGVVVSIVAWRRPRTPPAAEHSPWSLRRGDGSRYQLTYTGAGHVRNVKIEPSGHVRADDCGPWDRVDAGSSVEPLIITAWTTAPKLLTVRWDDGLRHREWTTTLPTTR